MILVFGVGGGESGGGTGYVGELREGGGRCVRKTIVAEEARDEERDENDAKRQMRDSARLNSTSIRHRQARTTAGECSFSASERAESHGART